MGCVEQQYYWDGCGLEQIVQPGNAATTFYPSAYVQAIDVGVVEQPLARYEQPVGPNNVVDTEIPAAEVGGGLQAADAGGYIPAFVREAPIGESFEIGFDGIGVMSPYHGIIVTVNGIPVGF